MTVQPMDYRPGPTERPRTIRAIRAALTTEQRARFSQALEDADPADLFALVGRWAALAQVNSDPTVDQQADAVRAGTAPTHSIGEVIPALEGHL
jgi:hypothetical protein